jgi:hypothetical protein
MCQAEIPDIKGVSLAWQAPHRFTVNIDGDQAKLSTLRMMIAPRGADLLKIRATPVDLRRRRQEPAREWIDSAM